MNIFTWPECSLRSNFILWPVDSNKNLSSEQVLKNWFRSTSVGRQSWPYLLFVSIVKNSTNGFLVARLISLVLRLVV